MSFQRGVLIGSALLAIGSLSWASASAPAGQAGVAPAAKPAAVQASVNKVLPRVPAPKIETISQSAPNQDLGGGLSLVAPPAELPRTAAVAPTVSPPAAPPAAPAPVAKSAKAVPSPAAATPAAVSSRKAETGEQLKAFTEKVRAQLAAETAAASKAGKSQARKKSVMPAATAPTAGELTIVPAPQEHSAGSKAASVPARATSPRQQIQGAAAPAAKPGKLFSYVRLLNYAPHPNVEEFLKDRPLALKNRNYWFSVKYIEGWKALSDDEGLLQNVCFEISLMDGDRKIRTLRTPKVEIKPESIAKGQILGIAEVPPYRFYITVDQFTLKKQGVSELVFRLDLLG